MFLPTQTQPPEGKIPPVRFLELPVEQLHTVAGTLSDMMDMRYTGLLVRGAFDSDALRGGLARLLAPTPPSRQFDLRCFGETVPERPDPKYAGFSYGLPLTNSTANLAYYFGAAAEVRATIRAIFGDYDFEGAFQRVLGAISGLPMELAPGPEGAHYAPMTIRCLKQGATLTIHRGNEFLGWASNHDLVQRIDTRDQISFFTPLQRPPKGGGLLVYPGYFPPHEREALELLSPEAFSEADERLGGILLEPDVGDLIVFDGGRYLHRVTRVEGADRWTIGGFLSPSKQWDKVHYWS